MYVPVTKENLIEQLRVVFPELEEPYKAELQRWQGEQHPGNYDFLAFVFRPQFKKDLETRVITDFLRRSSAFFERVCTSGDLEAINVVWIKIFEWLIHRPKELKKLWPILGQATRAMIEDAAQRWGVTNNLPNTRSVE